jgi:hypothetical protein
MFDSASRPSAKGTVDGRLAVVRPRQTVTTPLQPVPAPATPRRLRRTLPEVADRWRKTPLRDRRSCSPLLPSPDSNTYPLAISRPQKPEMPATRALSPATAMIVIAHHGWASQPCQPGTSRRCRSAYQTECRRVPRSFHSSSLVDAEGAEDRPRFRLPGSRPGAGSMNTARESEVGD